VRSECSACTLWPSCTPRGVSRRQSGSRVLSLAAMGRLPACHSPGGASTGRMPNAPLGRLLGMEPDDPMVRVRERRLRALVDELLPKVRRLNPTLPDDQVLELAESMAGLRLLDEEIG
jgi:hypothetical protein